MYLTGDDKGLHDTLATSQDTLRTWGGGVGDVLRTALGTGLAFLGSAIIQEGFGAIKQGLQDIVTSGMEAEQTATQLNAAMESTGAVARGITAAGLAELAKSISELTPIEDDAVAATEAMLLHFGNIGGDVFPVAIKAITDMAVAMNSGATPSMEDLTAKAIQVGKALNDPIGGLGTLAKAGVVLSDSQKALIQTMMDTNDIAGAQGVILDELQKKFGGSAEAAGTTFAGQVEILRNKLDNLKEDIGMALLPALTKLMEAGQPLVTMFFEAIGKALPPLVDGLTNLVSVVMDIGTSMAGAFATGGVVAGIQAFLAEIGKLVPGLDPMLSVVSQLAAQVLPAFAAAMQFVAQHSAEFQGALIAIGALLVGGTVVTGIASLAAGLVALANPITAIVVAVGLLGAAWAGNWGGIQDKTRAVIDFLTPYIQMFVALISQFWQEHGAQIIQIVNAIWDTIQTVFQAIGQVLRAHSDDVNTILGGAWMVVSNTIRLALDVILGILEVALDIMRGDWSAAWEDFKSLVSNVMLDIANIIRGDVGIISGLLNMTGLADAGRNMVNSLRDGFTGAWNGLVADVNNMVSGLVSNLNGLFSGAALAGIGSNLVGGLWNGIVTAWNATMGNLASLVSSIIPSMTTALDPNSLLAAGYNVIVNLWNGIANAWNAISPISKLWDLFRSLIQSVKDVLGIGSPSTIFSSIGSDLIAGFWNGIKSAWDSLVSNLQGLMSSLTQTFKDLWSSIFPNTTAPPTTGAGNVQVNNINVTIAPGGVVVGGADNAALGKRIGDAIFQALVDVANGEMALPAPAL